MSNRVVEVMAGVARPTRTPWDPSFWGDHFLKYASTDDSLTNEKENLLHGELKEYVNEKLKSKHFSTREKLNFIDNIQRLGVSYHFNTEIEEILGCMYIDDQGMNQDYGNENLHDCALHFRLLRQQGYNVSADMFKKFLDTEGDLKSTSIKNDIKGMLSLQEATHLRFRGEDILEKAFNFTTKQFETMLLYNRADLDHINPHLAKQVTHSLKQSLLRGFIRIDARNYLSFYENSNAHDTKLLEFAKFDFNILQRTYQKELAELTRWWNELNFLNKCPFARNRLVECYFLSLTVYFEPKYAYGRKVIIKMVTLISVLDDIYDTYGTWEELILLTDAINRWEKIDLDGFSESIIYFIDALYDFIEVTHNECVERDIVHGIKYLKEMVKVVANAYMQEAKWLHIKHIPTLEEYMCVASFTSGTRILIVASIIGLDPVLATEETFQWAFEDPPIMKFVAAIVRLIDDIVDFKFEQDKEFLVSAVQCYINQYGVSEDNAISKLKLLVKDGWKDINFELIQPSNVPKSLLHRVVGLGIYMVLYDEIDGYTYPHSKAEDLANLFVNPVDV